MSLENNVRDFLKSDATLVALLTGGIYSFSDDAKTNGINRNDTPGAYGTSGLKPCAVVKCPQERIWGGINDGKVHSRSARCEIYLYDDGKRKRDDAIEAAKTRLEAIFDAEFHTTIGHSRLLGYVEGRDIEMLNALFSRADFQIVGVR